MTGRRDGPPEPDTRRTRRGARGAPVWLSHDKLIRLREWASETAHALPGPDVAAVVIGSAPPVDPSVGLPLVDPSQSVSRKHARLIRVEDIWKIEDLHSRNGIRCDGRAAPTRQFPIVPGMEIGIGSLTLVAENATLVRLHRYLAGALGKPATSPQAVDLAMRAVRASANRRGPLVIVGADDLVAVARQIHLRATPPLAPFVVCGTSPRKPDTEVGGITSLADVSAAFTRATGGTVCVRADDLPTRYDDLLEMTGNPLAVASLFICTKKVAKRTDPVERAQPIVIPKLVGRQPDDLHDLIWEYALDAIRELRAAPTSFTESWCEWVARNAAKTFVELEVATLRVVALADAGNPHQAAARLGLSHVAFSDWFKRRGFHP